MNTPATSTRHTIVLEVGGQRLRLAANADPAHLEHLAATVNERAEQLQRSTRNATPATVLALIALDLADELFAARRRVDDAQNEARRAVAAAESRAREVEQAARRAVVDAIAEIDRTLLADEALAAKSAAESETA